MQVSVARSDDELDKAEQAGRSRRFLRFGSAHSRPDPLTYNSEEGSDSSEQQAAREPRVVDMSQNADRREQRSSARDTAEDEGEEDMAENLQDQDAEDESSEDEEAEPYWVADTYEEDPDPEHDSGESAEAGAEPDLAMKRFRRSDGWTVLNASLEEGAQLVQHGEAHKRAPGLRSVEDVILRKADMRKEPESEAPAGQEPDAELLEAASSAMAGASAVSAADTSLIAPHRQQEASHKGALMTSSSYVLEIESDLACDAPQVIWNTLRRPRRDCSMYMHLHVASGSSLQPEKIEGLQHTAHAGQGHGKTCLDAVCRVKVVASPGSAHGQAVYGLLAQQAHGTALIWGCCTQACRAISQGQKLSCLLIRTRRHAVSGSNPAW